MKYGYKYMCVLKRLEGKEDGQARRPLWKADIWEQMITWQNSFPGRGTKKC